MTTIPDSHMDLIEATNTAVLTTVGADGMPQSTAVWYLLDDDGVLKTSISTDRQKYKNLARHPKGTLFILDPANPQRYLEVRADIELTPDPEKALVHKFAARYHVPAEILLSAGGDRVIASFSPVRVNTIG